MSRKRKDIFWFRKRIFQWYLTEGRRFPWRNKSASKCQLIIAEVLLQRTKAETVARFYPRFIQKYPSWKALSKAKEKGLQAFLKPIGLWRQRATAIKNLSAEMAKRNGRFPKTREEIEKIPAIGQYIANAVLMFCHGQPQPLLDVNMARVLERFFGPRKLADIRDDPYLQELSREILPKSRFREFNWTILDFASMICKPQKPLCENCCLANKCLFFQKYMILKRDK